MTPEIRFGRSQKINVTIKSPSETRGFVFKVSASFAGALDPLSGMVVDLPLVDAWLEDVSKMSFERNWSSLTEWLVALHDHLLKRSNKNALRLASLSVEEARGWAFEARPRFNDAEFVFWSRQYLECPVEGVHSLEVLEIGWGLRLKNSPDPPFDFEELRQKALNLSRGLRLPAGTPRAAAFEACFKDVSEKDPQVEGLRIQRLSPAGSWEFYRGSGL